MSLIYTLLLSSTFALYSLVATFLLIKNSKLRILFFLICFFSLYGVQSLTFSIFGENINNCMLFHPGEDMVKALTENSNLFGRALFMSAIATTVFGLPLIYWLKNNLRNN